MILYNHPAENYFWRILGNLRPAEHSLPPPVKVLTMNRDFFFFLSKIQRYMDNKKKKSSNSQCLMCAHKTGTKKSMSILVSYATKRAEAAICTVKCNHGKEVSKSFGILKNV